MAWNRTTVSWSLDRSLVTLLTELSCLHVCYANRQFKAVPCAKEVTQFSYIEEANFHTVHLFYTFLPLQISNYVAIVE
jgi:hypothetical protein